MGLESSPFFLQRLPSVWKDESLDMASENLRLDLESVIAPLVVSQGLELWGIEYVAGKRSILRIYVEAPRQLREEGVSVTIDQCAKVSRDVGLALDVEDIVPGAYVLEVSSPGMQRPFFSTEQMTEYLGQIVSLSMRQPLGGRHGQRKNVKGVLLEILGGEVVLDLDGEKLRVFWDDVKKARLSPLVEIPKKQDGKRKRKQDAKHRE